MCFIVFEHFPNFSILFDFSSCLLLFAFFVLFGTFQNFSDFAAFCTFRAKLPEKTFWLFVFSGNFCISPPKYVHSPSQPQPGGGGAGPEMPDA